MLRKTLFLASLIIVTAYPVIADQVTSGFVSITRTRTTLSFGATGFSVSGDAETSPTVTLPCSFCFAGNNLNLSYDPFLASPDFFFGSVVVNGSSYTISTSPLIPHLPLIRFSFNGPFTAGVVTVPDSGATTLALTAAFTLSGGMAGSSQEMPTVFGMGLTGSGIATLRLNLVTDPNGNPAYRFQQLVFSFGAAPVPEPASISLLALAMTACAFRLRKQQ